MEWIDPKDKLPEYDQRILIFTQGEGFKDIELGVFAEGRPYSGFNKDGFYIWAADHEDYILVDALFWMPLPNQPERSKREDNAK